MNFYQTDKVAISTDNFISGFSCGGDWSRWTGHITDMYMYGWWTISTATVWGYNLSLLSQHPLSLLMSTLSTSKYLYYSLNRESSL